jgi:hypothetical protein
MCTYTGRQLWWSAIMTFLLRHGSRNSFDADRNRGQFPENFLAICGESWEEERLGARRTVTCSENVLKQVARVPVTQVAQIPLNMARRLMNMRLLDEGRLFKHWWLVAVDGTLQDRGRATPSHLARYRYVVEAALAGPNGLMIPLATEFHDIYDPVRDKEDCETNAFHRLAQRLYEEFPRLPICLLLDGLYPMQSVFDRITSYGWRFIATLREGRQPNAWDEAVETMMMSPEFVKCTRRQGEDGWVEQTLRWTRQIPFGTHSFDVLFCGEVGPSATTLWTWVTNFKLTEERVATIVNEGGRARNRIETIFNVQKNGGFGLEHAFCADERASRNFHITMQIAYILGQLLVMGPLRRLTQLCRKITHIKLIALLAENLFTVRMDLTLPAFGQFRFCSSA